MDGFFLIIVIICYILLVSLPLLIYLPFKIWLRRSGRLSRSTSRQILWSYFALVCITGVILFCFKDNRTPSKERLEKIGDIKLPNTYQVLSDEYYDSFRGYSIEYKIRLATTATNELIKNIQGSKFYTARLFKDQKFDESDFIGTDSLKALWYKAPNGYNFNGSSTRMNYIIELDTITSILKYNEFGG
jgi:hypothetical protein